MEDVLDVYCQTYDPKVPRICMDEMGKNLVKDKYPPEPAKPGQIAREDYRYEKEGSANLFIAYEPLAGKRSLKVTEHRTRILGTRQRKHRKKYPFWQFVAVYCLSRSRAQAHPFHQVKGRVQQYVPRSWLSMFLLTESHS